MRAGDTAPLTINKVSGQHERKVTAVRQWSDCCQASRGDSRMGQAPRLKAHGWDHETFPSTSYEVPTSEARLAVSPDDAAHRGVVSGHVDLDGIPGDDADHATLAHLAGRTGSDLMSRFEFHPKRGIWERFGHNALCPEVVVLACDECLLSIRPRCMAHNGRAEEAIVVRDRASRHSAERADACHTPTGVSNPSGFTVSTAVSINPSTCSAVLPMNTPFRPVRASVPITTTLG